jgi:putative transposase
VIAALTTLVAAKSRWGFWKMLYPTPARWAIHGITNGSGVLLSIPVEPATTYEAAAPGPAPPASCGPPAAQCGLGRGLHECSLYGGRRFRTLNVLDEEVREGLAIVRQISAGRVITKSGSMTLWQASHSPCIGPILKPAVHPWGCLVDRELTKRLHSE